MARTWLRIKVDLLGGHGVDLKPTPGRVFIVGPSHTFGDLAEAIDLAFARWDLAHLHGFELADGRRIGIFDPDYPGDWLDETTLKVAKETGPGDVFDYTFDFGDDWRHRCTVEPEKADPMEEYGAKPSAPVPIWGWGAIPDQYFRDSLD
jgi:Plasmid pRiA4b ORF-3-like protein